VTAEGRLTGQVAVVTGAARGIGASVAQRLHADGAQVVLCDLDGDAARAACGALGGQASSARLDVTDRAAVTEFVTAAERELGRIDVWANVAGASAPNMPLWELPTEQWDRVLQVNLTGVFHCCSAVVPGMRERGYGRIVNVASIAGLEGNPNSGAYSAAKAGVIGLTKSLGKELARDGVSVNAVAPTAIETDMFHNLSEASKTYMLSRIPMGRPGRKEELAALISWLSSPECSFSTGAVFDFSGGRATY
jgi:3-oxoacyl-[acyl-carrier protein] reductase